MPRLRAFRVAAIFEVGMFEYDNSFVFVPLEAAQLFFRQEGQATGIEVFVKDPQRVWLARSAILQALEKVRWNRTAAAQLLGLTFRQLRYRIAKLGLEDKVPPVP